MRRYLLVLAVGCSIPDKLPSTGDAGTGDTAPTGPIDTTITKAPKDFSNDPTATFEFTSSFPGARFVCRIDREPTSDCRSPFTQRLDDGSHTFSVRATDGRGGGDDTPAEHVWMIDTVPPATRLTETPPAADNSTMVTFAFESSEANVVFECRLDGGAYATCRSGDSFGPVGDGAHAFSVRARDRAGNVDASPAVHAWQVDTSTPDTTLLDGPPNASPTRSATFTFVSPDAGPGAIFECALDSNIFLLCGSPQRYIALAEGTHTFQVRVRDLGGNVDPTPATDTWRVDLTPPDTTIESGPSGAVANAAASITFDASEADVTFACSIDGAPFTPCTSPFNATGLAQGMHVFAARATDAAGHDDPSPAIATWTVDTVPPELQIVGGPSEGSTVGPRVTMMFTLSEGAARCRLDGGAFTACASPVSFNVPAGAHSFAVGAIDLAGNTATVTRSWTVACAAPDPSGAAGLLHLDDDDQVQANATGGAAALLGTSDMAEPSDPMSSPGRFGGALDFAATEGDQVTWPIALGATSDLAIELWTRPAALAGTRDVLVTGDDRVALRVTQVTASTVELAATFVGAGGVTFTGTSAPVSAGDWHWVLVTLQEPTLRLWVDGTATTVGDVRLGQSPTLDVVRLGGNYGGAIDELYLSQTSIATDEAALARYCPR